MELWRQCAMWLIECRVLPENHRVTWEGAQVNQLCHIHTCNWTHILSGCLSLILCVCVCVCAGPGVWPGSGSERWCAALPVAQQPDASSCQPERDQPAPTDVPGNTHTFSWCISIFHFPKDQAGAWSDRKIIWSISDHIRGQNRDVKSEKNDRQREKILSTQRQHTWVLRLQPWPLHSTKLNWASWAKINLISC